MTTALSPEDIELLRGENYAYLITLNPDGTPHVTVTWVDATDEGLVLVNSAVGRKKDRNIRRDPRVALAVSRRGDPYDWTSINGTVEELVEGDEALAHIDALSRRYDHEPWTPTEGQVRVIYRIGPERVHRYSDG
jgi:PPOX class probable F420-dependent enzyme